MAPAPLVHARGDVWVAPQVRVRTGWGEPLFVVDGTAYLWRGGDWHRWSGTGWQRTEPPLALLTLQGEP